MKKNLSITSYLNRTKKLGYVTTDEAIRSERYRVIWLPSEIPLISDTSPKRQVLIAHKHNVSTDLVVASMWLTLLGLYSNADKNKKQCFEILSKSRVAFQYEDCPSRYRDSNDINTVLSEIIGIRTLIRRKICIRDGQQMFSITNIFLHISSAIWHHFVGGSDEFR